MEPTTVAERTLLVAARAGEVCDLRTPAEKRVVRSPTVDEAVAWGADRTIRAEFLRHILVDEALAVHLRGAHVEGDLDLESKSNRVELSFQHGVFAGAVGFGWATFTGAAWFDRATFTGDARFDRATFTGDARFRGAMFTGDARFRGAMFTGAAWFDGAMFTGAAWFDRATFTGAARFRGAMFTGAARFNRATFTGAARFHGAMFTGAAWFDRATFTGAALFDGAMFTGAALFDGAMFTGAARFDRATFTGAAYLEGVRCKKMDWTDARWKSETLLTTGLVACEISLQGAVFEHPVSLNLTARRIDLKKVRFKERLHLVVAAAEVDCANAELAAGSLIESIPVDKPSNDRWVQPGHSAEVVEELNTLLVETFKSNRRAAITSLQYAHIAGTTLSGMDLRKCRFGSVDGLDKLIIAGDDILNNYRDVDKHGNAATDGLRRRWWRTDRRVIGDELALGTSTKEATERREPRAVAATYRSLRKALEDSKDEPGAADFYYGEMEMRRMAAGMWSVERWMLTAYWAASGYGLRAWRALTALLLVIAVAGWCFTNGAWATGKTVSTPTKVDLTTGVITSTAPDPEGLSVMRSLLFAAQETVALFRPAGASDVTLVGAGPYIALLPRILGPILLALAVLAIRNRTKR